MPFSRIERHGTHLGKTRQRDSRVERVRRGIRWAGMLAGLGSAAAILTHVTAAPDRPPPRIVVIPGVPDAARPPVSTDASAPLGDRWASGPAATGFGDTRRFYALVRTEPRDAEWAGRTEIALRLALARDFRMDDESPLDVTCSATICEASGDLSNQAGDLRYRLRLLGMRGTTIATGPGNVHVVGVESGRSGSSFTFYFQRATQ